MLEKLFDMDLVMKVCKNITCTLSWWCFPNADIIPYLNSALQARTVREFDKQFTSVMFGYRTIDDYYEDASPCRKLKSVGIPVLCLNSVDDVFSPGHGKFSFFFKRISLFVQSLRQTIKVWEWTVCEVVCKYYLRIGSQPPGVGQSCSLLSIKHIQNSWVQRGLIRMERRRSTWGGSH